MKEKMLCKNPKTKTLKTMKNIRSGKKKQIVRFWQKKKHLIELLFHLHKLCDRASHNMHKVI